MATKEAERQITIDDLMALDLDALHLEIHEMEGQLEIDTQARQAEIDKRKAFAKAVSVIKFGKPPRKKREMKPKAPEPTQRVPADAPAKRGRPSAADKIEQVILANGPLVKSQIMRHAALSDDATAFALNNDERFIMDSSGKWSLR